jgi:hypothetical protein
MKQIVSAVKDNETPMLSFCARIESTVIATFLISKDFNLEYIVSHFHIQD